MNLINLINLTNFKLKIQTPEMKSKIKKIIIKNNKCFKNIYI
jgi:hypothetical protein